MFRVERQQRLAELSWATEDEKSLYYIEGWLYEDAGGSAPHDYRHGPLKCSEVIQWLNMEVNTSGGLRASLEQALSKTSTPGMLVGEYKKKANPGRAHSRHQNPPSQKRT